MIKDWVAETISKYTFITNAEIKGTYLYLQYQYNNLPKTKKISVRTTKEKLIASIEGIKHDIGYYEEKKIRDKKVIEALEKDKTRPLIFVHKE